MFMAVCCSGPAAAQQTGAPTVPPASGVLIAVIDIGYVFKNHPQFQQQMEAIKGQVKAFEAEVTRELRPPNGRYRGDR